MSQNLNALLKAILMAGKYFQFNVYNSGNKASPSYKLLSVYYERIKV